MPTFGRPTHAQVLLELGDIKRCQRALAVGEWKSEMFRHRQVGVFEVLESKLILAEAQTERGKRRGIGMERALDVVDRAINLAKGGPPYSWWLTFATLAKAEILLNLQNWRESEEEFSQAGILSVEHEFRLLEVDALLGLAKVEVARQRQSSAREIALKGRKKAVELGYLSRLQAFDRIMQQRK
jgi:hypothetical protein